MIQGYYLRHRYLELTRSNSNGGAWFAFIFLVIFGLQTSIAIYQELPEMLNEYQVLIGSSSLMVAAKSLFVVYLLIDFVVKLIFNPLPLKLKHYALLSANRTDIAVSYQLYSLFSPVQLLLLLLSIPLVSRFSEYFDATVLTFMILWLTSHFLAVSFHHIRSIYRNGFIGLISTILIAHFYWNIDLITDFSPEWLVLVLVVSVSLSIYVIGQFALHYQVNEKAPSSWMENWLTGLAFGSPLMRLEWALMMRNKRTRSNLIVGLVSILFVVIMIAKGKEEVSLFPFFLVSLFLSGFVMIQHGIYMLAWEGSYFDFLITRIRMTDFIHFKYRFFVSSSIALMLFVLPFFIDKPLLLLSLLAAGLYNIAINSIIVLSGSLANTVKLDLSRTTVFNYQGLNGTLMVNSILIVFLPMICFGLLRSQFGDIYASLVIVIIGGVIIVFHRLLLKNIVAKLEQRKYSLAKGYRS